MRRLAWLAVALAAACAPAVPPEPEVGAGNWLLPGTTWRLVELDGAPFAARATATLTPDGRVVGEAPCNAFRAEWTGRWPDIRFTPAAATRRACPDLEAEAAFFAALAATSRASLGENGLTLSGEGGRSLRFVRA